MCTQNALNTTSSLRVGIFRAKCWAVSHESSFSVSSGQVMVVKSLLVIIFLKCARLTNQLFSLLSGQFQIWHLLKGFFFLSSLILNWMSIPYAACCPPNRCFHWCSRKPAGDSSDQSHTIKSNYSLFDKELHPEFLVLFLLTVMELTDLLFVLQRGIFLEVRQYPPLVSCGVNHN